VLKNFYKSQFNGLFNIKLFYNLKGVYWIPNRLPCVRCGASSSIVEGSLHQCFFCGAKSGYSESINLLNKYSAEILNIPSVLDISKEPSTEELASRRSQIESFFHDLSSRFYEYKYFIITKLDEEEIENENLLTLIQATGNLEVIIEEYLLPYLKDEMAKKNIQEILALTHIFNKSTLGLYFSNIAREKFQLEDCSNNYEFSERNYKDIIEYCDKIKLESHSFNVNQTKALYSVIINFAIILRNVLSENPTYSSEKLEDYLKELDNIEEKNVQALNLYSQIERIYHLGRDNSLLLEDLRVGNLFSSIDPLEENLIYNAEENIEKLDRIKNWIEETSDKYQSYQKSLLRLHSGKFIEYLETYRTEFTNRKRKSIEKYDNLLEDIINKALGDYNLETMEILDIISDIIQKLELSNEIITQRFEIEHDDLIKMDESLKDFVITLTKSTINKNLEADYYKDLVKLIAEKHADFDNRILKYINNLLKNFEELRNEKTLSMEEQRNIFILDLRPNISRLIDASFTLRDELIPYPLFLEIIMLTKKLTVNTPEEVTVLVENPSTSEIRNVNISFFVPKSFQSKLRFAQLKKIKPLEIRKVETEIAPTEPGIYHFMIMIEYSHTNETFWMPSIRIELEVEEEL
jgi:hypothetical protein